MVTVADVREWRPELLDAAFDQLRRCRDRLVALDDELVAIRSPPEWEGAAAAAARLGYARLAEDVRRLVAGVSAVLRADGEAADRAIAVIAALDEADALAFAHGFQITGAGVVLDVHPPAPDLADFDAIQAERAGVRDELVSRVEQVLRNAADVGADLAGVMGQAAAGRVDDGTATTTLAAAALGGHLAGGLSALGPPEGGTPADNGAWWNTLSDAERFALVSGQPELIGNMDGIPAETRDAANRGRIPEERAALQAEATRLQGTLNPVEPNVAAASQLAQVQDKLRALDAIEATLAKPGERQLLVLDTSGERVKAAVARGNLDTADHVTVFTPGLTSNVQDSLSGYDDQMDLLRMEAQDQAEFYGDGGEVAAVTWIGYEAPQLGETLDPGDSVAGAGAARRGGQQLAGFLDGINGSRAEDPHLSALGHSYGSTTTGYALQEAHGVDDVVFFGSPGIGTSDVADLNVGAGHAYVIEADWDGVGDLGRFGADPNQLDGVRNLSADEATYQGERLAGVSGHTNYLAEGSTSQRNMGVVVGGVEDRTIAGDNSGAGDHLRDPRNWNWGTW